MRVAKTNQNLLCDRLIWLFTIIYFVSSYILITFSWGRYILLLAVLGILFMVACKNSGKISIPNLKYPKLMAPFILFCFASIVWARDSNAALSKCITITQILIFTWIIAIGFCQITDIKKLLRVVMFSGYLECGFLFWHFGFSSLMDYTSARLSGDVGNVNFIGMLMTMTVVITLYEILFEGARWFHLGGIVAVYIIAISQSRTALIGLVIGFFALMMFKALESKNKRFVIFRILIYICLAVGVFALVSQFSFFDPIKIRMQNLLIQFTGRGAIQGGEQSVGLRSQMIQIGIEQFWETPILGMGIGNAFIIAGEKLGHSTYLHNNFIELLVDTGVIGFCLYYSIYTYLFTQYYKYRNYRNSAFYVCLTLMITQLLMDYGTVSYYTKDTYLYFLIYFIELSIIKKNAVRSSQDKQHFSR